jgi:hypothetical protein
MTVQREHAFQCVVDRFLHRVVVAPFWTTGINHENELTDNARARARDRGVKGGVPDVYVCQRGKSCWIELKWGKNGPSEPQLATHEALADCSIPRAFAWSIHEVLAALRDAGLLLHLNAANLAVEYQARAEAAVAKAEARASSPRSAPRSKPRNAGRTRKGAAIYVAALPR